MTIAWLCFATRFAFVWSSLNNCSHLETTDESRIIDEYRASLTVGAAKEMFEQQASNIRSIDSAKRHKALIFLHDISANNLLAATLKDKSNCDVIIMEELSAAFRIDDLISIYTAFSKRYPFNRFGAGDGGAGFLNIVCQLNRRIEVLLRVVPQIDTIETKNPSWFEYDVFELKGFRESWREILETAIKKKTLDKPLDELIDTIRDAR